MRTKLKLVMLGLSLLAASPATAGNSILMCDFQGKGVFRHEQSLALKDSPVQKKGSYMNVVWRGKGFSGMKCVGEKKIDFTKCGSVSFDVRVRKLGEKFDPTRVVRVTLTQWEGGKEHYWLLDHKLEGMTVDGKWYRVTMPTSQAYTPDTPPSGKDAIFAVCIGLDGNREIEDEVEADLDNLVAHPVAPAETAVTPIDK